MIWIFVMIQRKKTSLTVFWFPKRTKGLEKNVKKLKESKIKGIE